jgi:hypothetical protein
MWEMDNLHKLNNELPMEQDHPARMSNHFTIDQAVVDVLAALHAPHETGAKGIIDEADDAPFPDPFTSDHTIEYWVWTGSRLVPASPDQAARLRRQEELEAEEFRLLQEHKRAYRQQRWQLYSQVVQWLLVLLHHLAARLGTLSSRVGLLARKRVSRET